MQIGDVESSKVLWDAIKARHMGADRVKEARLQTLMAKFDHLKMSDSESIDDFAGKLSGLASKSVALGEVIDETKLVKKFLNSLPREKFIHIVASLEHVLDLKTNGFEDVVGRLKAYEEEIREEDIGGKDQVKVLFVDHGGSTNWKSQKGTKGKGPNGSNNVNGYNGSGGSNSANRASDGGKVKQQWPNNNQKLNQPMNSNDSNQKNKERPVQNYLLLVQ